MCPFVQEIAPFFRVSVQSCLDIAKEVTDLPASRKRVAVSSLLTLVGSVVELVAIEVGSGGEIGFERRWI